LLRVLAATALARGVFFMGGPGSDDPTQSSATITGSAASEQFRHDSPDRVTQFSATDSREAEGERSHARMSFTQLHTPDGELVSATITGSLETRVGGGGRADAGATYDVYLYELVGAVDVSAQVTMSTSGSEFINAYAGFDLDLECGEREIEHEVDASSGGGDPPQSESESFDEPFEADGDSDCSFHLGASIGGASNREAPGESSTASLTFELRITTAAVAEPEGCQGVHGVVRDGAEDDDHQNPLRGVRVELRNETSPVGDPVTADEGGAYCLGEDVDPGTYRVRATLVDDTFDPPLFETKHADGSTPNWIEVPVTAEDFDAERPVDVAFTASDNYQIADMANVHWQAERFVRWLTTTGRISAQVLSPFTITTFGDGTYYIGGEGSIVISGPTSGNDNSTFEARDEPHDTAPENGEWHEVGHHLGASIGIGGGQTGSCPLDGNHDGWLNPTTCDSLREGFAGWIATAASLDLDAGRGEGYADAEYAQFGSLEANRYRPWTQLPVEGGLKQYEAMTVRQLLWDLADDTPDEELELLLVTQPQPDGVLHVASDRVTLGSVNLVHLMAESSPDSIADLYAGLVASPLVAQNLKTPDVDLDGDGTADIGPLDEVFLMHSFHHLRSYLPAAYTVGDPFGRTDRPSSMEDGAPMVERHHDVALPGSAVRLRNPSTLDVQVVLEITGHGSTERRTYLVPAASERLVTVEVPPYWADTRPVDALPPCEEAVTALRTTLTVTSPGISPASIDGCDYLHAIGSEDGFAWDVAVARGDAGGPTATGPAAPGTADAAAATVPTVIGGAVALIVAVVAGLLLVRSRRRA
jgi:hypothetical protein